MVKTLPSLIASLRHYIALYQGNILPLPGTKRYIGRENPHSLFYSSLFTKSPEIPINTGVPRGEEWRTTLHHSSPTLHLDIFSSDYAELTEHSCSTDYARILNGNSTCSVFEESLADIADDADIFLPLGVSADLLSAVKKCSTFSLRICNPLGRLTEERKMQFRRICNPSYKKVRLIKPGDLQSPLNL